jgi:hypothetical protein
VSSNEKPVAKSLHTITVIVQLARHIMAESGADAESAADRAMEILGLAGRLDPYELRGAALKQLLK